MDEKELKEHMLKYDFVKNTIKNFSKTYNCSEKYVYIKIREYNLPHRTRVKTDIHRDRLGRFTFKNASTSKTFNNETSNVNENYCLFKKHVPLDEKIRKLKKK